MAALTQDRETVERYCERIVADDQLVAANTTVWAGSIVAANTSDGALRPAADVVNIRVLGIAPRRLVNSTGASAKALHGASVKKGSFHFDNLAGGNALTAADIGNNCFVVDDHTVGRQAGTTNAVVAGKVDGFSPDGQVIVNFL